MRKLILLFFLMMIILGLNSSPVEDLRFAIGLYSDGNFNLTQVELTKFIANNPESQYLNDARFLLANSLLSLKDYLRADEIFSQLNLPDISPVIRADVLLGQAQCKYFLQQQKEAEQLLLSFLSNNGQHELSWKAEYFLGLLAAGKEDHITALKYFNSALENSADADLKIAILKSMLALEQLENADKLISNLDLKELENQQAVIIYNNLNLQKDRWNRILETELQNISSGSQYYSDYFLLRGIAEYNLGNYSEALSELKNADSEKASYYSALCYFEKNDTNKASKILSSLQTSDNEEIKINSFFYLAKMEENKQESNRMLENFTQDHPDSDFTPVALYLLGFNQFETGSYADASTKFKQAAEKSEMLNSVSFQASYQEQNTFLTAEALYMNNELDNALPFYRKYLNNYPDGIFYDEAIFKMGLLSYERKKLTDAANEFRILITDFPESSKVGMSNYYLGEISFLQDNLKEALSYFTKALSGKCDLGYTWERIARIHFRNKNYQRSLEALKNIPNENKYLFEKFLLEGNANFAIRKLEKALQAFEFAEEYAPGTDANEIALSRKAWTLYQMKRFKEASQLYSRLSGSTSSPQQYLIKAANAAFSAEDFIRAIEIYKQYLENFSDADDIPSTLLGIADSYYNLGDFSSSAEYYQKLITPDSDKKMLNNSLNGLRWAAEQNDQVDFLQVIDDLLISSNAIDFRLELLDRKLHYEFSKAKWNEAIAIADEMEKLSSSYSKLASVKLIRALCYSELGDYIQAENVYLELGADKPSAETLYNWALLKLKLSDQDAAIEKLRLATQLSKRMDVWTKLLELEIAVDHIYFQNDQARYKEFAENEYDELADLFLIEWQIKNRKTGFDDKLKELGKSKNKLIKANVQFLKGYRLFISGDRENAIPDLLRVRYLYPEYQNIRIKAEVMALNAYLDSKRMEEAKQLFDTIKADLSERERNELNTRLNEEVK